MTHGCSRSSPRSPPPTSPSAVPPAPASGSPRPTGAGSPESTSDSSTTEQDQAHTGPRHPPRASSCLKGITMSKETLRHLNTNTLIGNTDQRGTAWHYRAEEQGEESNHYPGPIPVEDVERRLFHWRAESRPVAVEIPADLDTMTH